MQTHDTPEQGSVEVVLRESKCDLSADALKDAAQVFDRFALQSDLSANGLDHSADELDRSADGLDRSASELDRSAAISNLARSLDKSPDIAFVLGAYSKHCSCETSQCFR